MHHRTASRDADDVRHQSVEVEDTRSGNGSEYLSCNSVIIAAG